MTEWDVVKEMTCFYLGHGCSGTSFDPIVASGAGSSMPHYQTSRKKKIEKGDVILLDMGCVLDGYNSDLTRTFFIGDIDARLEKIYTIVNNARAKAIESVRPGITTGELDRIARDYISHNGYGDYFGHSLGHGVGLDIHEAPWLKKNTHEALEPGNVFTVEPGIYLPEIGGVRIEDMVLCTENGYEVMTQSSREIDSIGGLGEGLNPLGY
jgi:Xaa-Pro aminopeptidase